MPSSLLDVGQDPNLAQFRLPYSDLLQPLNKDSLSIDLDECLLFGFLRVKLYCVRPFSLRNFAGGMNKTLQAQGQLIFKPNKLNLPIVELLLYEIAVSFIFGSYFFSFKNIHYARHIACTV